MGRGPGVRAVGPRSIQIDFRYRGVRCREWLRLEPTKANLRYAQNLKARIEHEISTGHFRYEDHFPRSKRGQQLGDIRDSGMAVSTVLRLYVDGLEGSIEPETLADYKEYSSILGAAFQGELLGTLTRAKVREWVQKQTVSRKRINNLLTPLRGALRQAVEDGILKENPLLGFKLGRRVEAPKEVIDPLTPDELARLRACSQGQLWEFWAWTGLRTGELIALRWDDVSPAGDVIRIARAVRLGREKRPKSGAGVRTVSTVGPARRILGGMDRPTDGNKNLFPDPRTGKQFHGDKPIRLLFHADCEAAGVRRRRGPYVLRHTFASLALSSGEPLGWVSAMMGHKDPWMTLRVYAKWVPSVFPDAGQRMVKAAGGQSGA